MRMRLWYAVISGALVGLLVGVSLQIAREIRHERVMDMVDEFAPWPPPLMPELLKPEVIPLAVCLFFASLGAAICVGWSRQTPVGI